MAEQSKRRLSDRVHELVSMPLPESERRRRGLLLPELKLRADAPAIEIDAATPVIQALARLSEEETGVVAINEPHGRPRAMVLSVDRYLQLASKEINSAAKAGTPDGRLMPVETAFERAHVEQVNPGESWGNQAENAPI